MSPLAPTRYSSNLSEFDVVWLRQAPFDMNYITTTHILDHLAPGTLVVNDPFWVRNFPEKLLVLRFPDLTPATTITRDLATLHAFRDRHGDMILKRSTAMAAPACSGWSRDDFNLNALHELFTGFTREP